MPVRVPEGCNDDERVKALHRYNILDTPFERDFDDITRMVAHICNAPIAVINFVDRDRQWFKSEMGLGVRQTPLDVSICAHAILQPGLFIVPDTLKDQRFVNNPLVAGAPHLRFYAGALLQSDEGYALGTLCILDYQPRELDDHQKNAIQVMARQVMNQLNLRRALNAQAATLQEQLRIEADLRAAKESADAANRAKDQFMAALSHELRTPLTPVLMAAETLAADESLTPDVREAGRMIHRNIDLQVRLVSDLLDVSRITSGKLELKFAVIDLHEVIQQSAAMCRADMSAKSIELQMDLTAARHYVNGDTNRLQQVILNLLSNAIKFTPDNGRISISSVDGSDGQIEIKVTDTGRGIPSQHLAKIFNPFEQGGRSITRQYMGLGLGLAICKGIIEGHGGGISAGSDGVGKGASVLFRLAAVPTPAAANAEIQPATKQPANPWRILLVEDHEDSLRAMTRLLRGLKYKVHTATCVNTALSVAAENEIDLLISDVGLPDGSGLDLIRQLIAQRPIKGIALTGYGTADDVADAKAAGFTSHLTKPISFQQLEAAISNLRD